ncbi:PEP-CTERM sorting domain-containing protein [Pontiella sulfatireligans]|uniref:PEP-CTERM protein-sorting domain-containing protein n=1 Tax=Pontiella sulfatireligans TaxID=2750658 RepID=A0A6C2UD94_9BACT|nr:PEP-CTERM sorting domain-containing protein [Pontiella sulfatireligans]VGO18172.1 hypothetical protein SCARR_00223 [Pontiella sulfatireligans]
MKNRTAIQTVAMLVGMGIALPSMATSILNWDKANNLTAATDTSFQSNLSATDQVGTGENIRNYTQAGAFMSTGLDSNYIGQDMYGIIQTSSANGSSVDLDSAGSIINDDGALWLGVDGNTPDNNPGSPGVTTDTRSIAALVYFNAVGGVGNTLSAMSMSANNIGNVALRFAVQSGGNWYVSSDYLDVEGSLSYSSANWATLTTATSASTSLMTAEGLTYDVLGSALDNITAAGFFEEGGVVDSNARARVKFDTLTVEVIPEPATLGLVAAFGGGIILIRRRFMM